MTREYIAMFYCIFTILLLAERNGVENRECFRESFTWVGQRLLKKLPMKNFYQIWNFIQQ